MQQFLERFQSNFVKVENYFGNSLNKQFLISIASKYTIEQKEFSGVFLNKVVLQMNENMKIHSDSTLIYKIAAILMDEGNIDEEIHRLKEKDLALKEAGFKNSIYRVLGAMSLESNFHEHGKRAKILFDELKENQRILTSKEDIPYIICLSMDETNHPTLQVNTIVRYYEQLKQQRFSRGNYLQALSLIMTIFDEEYNDLLLQYVIQLRKELEKKNIPVKRIHYPFLGILALSQTDMKKIDEIATLYQLLIDNKPLRSLKNYALIVAIQQTIQQLENVPEVISLSKLEGLSAISDIMSYLDIIPIDIFEIISFFR